MIDVSNISFKYSGQKDLVFDNFSLRLEANNIYGLLGKNGTGKSTLLYLISGLLRPSKGRVRFDGVDTSARRPDVLSAEDLGHATGIYFHFADGEAEDLHIERTAYEGRDAWLLTFEHDRIPYRITIVPGGEELFDTLTANGRFTEVSGELLTYRYRAPENSSGIIYEKDAFGDLWIIEPGEPMKPEKMEDFADFLLNRWLY